MKDISCFIQQIESKCQNRLCSVFLASDSEKAASQFKEGLSKLQIPLLTLPGKSLHVDDLKNESVPGARDEAKAVEPYLKTFGDWAMFSLADEMILSHSGFGFTAAWWSYPSIPFVKFDHLRSDVKAGTCTWVHEVLFP